ncbi:hypothetical protein [Cyanobacterium aponinum]|uniref:O-antigen polymerase n=1 Tax=Cyanobacterium aponinum 0216 TaxID=2676140 RepID=A0A844GXH0_9CHRO|nr:hypothetical protein [Cyanobacterium aponinum]MTF38875.1 hypothetical protein [Cyanobacterium aponinum 0216]
MKIRKNNLIKFALYAYFALSPLYVFPSGTPQPSDMILAVLVFPLVIFSISQLPKHLRFIVKPFFLFVVWTMIVTLFNFYFVGNLKMLIYPLFYGFSLFFLMGLGILLKSYSKQDFLLLIQNLCFVASLVAITAYFLTWTPNLFRHSGSFNNPNQMAYFGVLIVCITGICAWGSDKWNLQVLITITIGSLMAILTLSISAAIAVVISLTGITFQIFLSKTVKFKVKYFVFTIMFLLYLSVPLVLTSNNVKVTSVLENWERRSEIADTKTENIMQERAYERILNYPDYLLFGAGEGARDRFASVWRGKNQEIHSTFGTILFSYGIVGFFLFCLYVKRSMLYAPLGVWVIIAGPLIYGITHQGARQPLFWLTFLTISIANSKIDKVRTKTFSTENNNYSALSKFS